MRYAGYAGWWQAVADDPGLAPANCMVEHSSRFYSACARASCEVEGPCCRAPQYGHVVPRERARYRCNSSVKSTYQPQYPAAVGYENYTTRSSRARVAAPARDETSSLARMLATCFFTVWMLITSCAA